MFLRVFETIFIYFYVLYVLIMKYGIFDVMSCYRSYVSGKRVKSAQKGYAEKGLFRTMSILTHFGYNGSRSLGNIVWYIFYLNVYYMCLNICLKCRFYV